MNVGRGMVFVQAQDDAEPAHKLLLASGQEFGGLRVDGLSPEPVREALERGGAGPFLAAGDVQGQNADHSRGLGLGCPGDDAIRKCTAGLERVKLAHGGRSGPFGYQGSGVPS